MATIKLTKRIVDSANPQGTRYVVWDAELKGFGVRIEPSGTKTYLVRYRPKGVPGVAPKRFMALGRHGPLSAEMARVEAMRILGAVACGEDPASEMAQAKQTLTVAEAATLFLSDHVDAKRKAKTGASYRIVLNTFVVPELGRLSVRQVERPHVAKLHKKMSSTPYQANRMLAVIGSMYSFLTKVGQVEEGQNPAQGIERYREQGRERYLTNEELGRLGATLKLAETEGLPWQLDPEKIASKHLAKPENRRTVHDPAAVAAIRLLMLTGARVREILNLRWDEVDLERGLAFLPDSKTGRKTLVLSTSVVGLLKNLERRGMYVIAGAKVDRPRADLKKPWAAILAHAGVAHTRLHDLRHTFASVGAGASLGLPIIGKLLGHSQPQTTARYSHLDASPLRRAADIIAELLTESLEQTERGPRTIESSAARRAKSPGEEAAVADEEAAPLIPYVK